MQIASGTDSHATLSVDVFWDGNEYEDLAVSCDTPVYSDSACSLSAKQARVDKLSFALACKDLLLEETKKIDFLDTADLVFWEDLLEDEKRELCRVAAKWFVMRIDDYIGFLSRSTDFDNLVIEVRRVPDYYTEMLFDGNLVRIRIGDYFLPLGDFHVVISHVVAKDVDAEPDREWFANELASHIESIYAEKGFHWQDIKNIADPSASSSSDDQSPYPLYCRARIAWYMPDLKRAAKDATCIAEIKAYADGKLSLRDAIFPRHV